MTSGTAHGWAKGSGRNKPVQVGWSARSGVAAARLAAAGCTCSLEVLEGDLGVLHAHTHGGPWSTERVLDGLGEQWRAAGLSIKLFPCGGIGQGTAESMQELHARGVRAGDVRSGVIHMPFWMKRALDGIGPELYRPTSGSTAIGAVPCIGARVLMAGTLRIDHQTDALVTQPEMLALADRLQVVPDEAVAHLPPDEQPVRVVLQTDGGEVSWSVVHEGGHPDRLTQDRVVRKFRENLGLCAGADQAAEIERLVLRADRLDDVRDLTKHVGAAG